MNKNKIKFFKQGKLFSLKSKKIIEKILKSFYV